MHERAGWWRPPDREQEFLVGQDLRSAQLERADQRQVARREREREGDVLDPYGLVGKRPSPNTGTTGDQHAAGQGRGSARSPGH